MDRGTCWAITINNPTEEDMTTTLPAKWTIIGQMEKGKDGTPHYQAMLTTPQVRFSAIKKVYPRAHIELAKTKLLYRSMLRKKIRVSAPYLIGAAIFLLCLIISTQSPVIGTTMSLLLFATNTTLW